MLEAVRETVLYPFVLPKKITIEAKSCGEPNAYWDPGSTTLTLCYELMGDFAELFPRSDLWSPSPFLPFKLPILILARDAGSADALQGGSEPRKPEKAHCGIHVPARHMNAGTVRNKHHADQQ
jgi:hypothetical protein